MWRRLLSLFRAQGSRSDFEAGMAEELRFHVEQYADDLVRSGVSREQAQRRAVLELGGFNTVSENCREARGLYFVDEFWRQLRHASRLVSKAPAFSAAAILTFALCLGANLTIFAVVDAILIRPLPFPEADRLVTIFNTYPKAGVERDGASITNYYERRSSLPAFQSLAIYLFGEAIVGEPGSSVRNPITRVSSEFFTTLGVSPALGRMFSESEMNDAGDQVVILNDEYWSEHFKRDPQVIGKRVWVDSFPKTVVGVLPRGFRFLSSKAVLYLPLASRREQRAPAEHHSGGNVIQMIARLKPGRSLREAQAQIDTQNTLLEKDDPQGKMMSDAGFRSVVVSLHGDQVSAIRPILLLLQAGVFLLLLIGVVNLINLLLMRAGSRLKELAVRQALGASTSRVAAEVLIETLSLTVAGGLVSVGVAAGGIRLVTALGADRLPLGSYIGFHAGLSIVAVAAAIVLGVVLAIPIALFSLRHYPADALQAESRTGTAGRAAQGLRHFFIVAQIALGVILLSGAGLLGLSLKRAMDVSPGFVAAETIAGQISLVGDRYPSPDAGLAFIDRLATQLSEQPGVSAVGAATNIPFSGSNGKSAATVQGHVRRAGESPRGNYSYGVAGNYFQAMGFRLRAGRFLTQEDSSRKTRTCVVDEDFARYNWPNQSAVGQRLFQGSQQGREGEGFLVVGVVGNIKQAGLTDDTAQGAVYYPYIYRADSNFFVIVRGGSGQDGLRVGLQTAVRRIDPNLAVNTIESMNDRISASLIDRRSPALLSAIFSGMGLLLLSVGTYGVLSYAVMQRRREIAIRMAVGASPAEIQKQFLWLAVRLLLAGATIGMLGAWLTGQAMQAVLFHVATQSLAIVAGSTGVIAVVALAACLVPAQRATRVSPMEVLAE